MEIHRIQSCWIVLPSTFLNSFVQSSRFEKHSLTAVGSHFIIHCEEVKILHLKMSFSVSQGLEYVWTHSHNLSLVHEGKGLSVLITTAFWTMLREWWLLGMVQISTMLWLLCGINLTKEVKQLYNGKKKGKSFMFMNWKNCYHHDVHTTQSNLHI